MYIPGDSDNIIVTNYELEKGKAYCLPKSRFCNSKVARPVYTSEGWSCIAKNPQVWTSTGKKVACTSPYAINNEYNILFDRKENSIVTIDTQIENLYEMYNGELRYECQCYSLDKMNNTMVSIPTMYPFVCFTDYCKKYVFQAGFKGWTGTECDCGPLKHLDVNDKTSPCVVSTTELNLNDSELTARVSCVDKFSTSIENVIFYCPDTYDNNLPNNVNFYAIATTREMYMEEAVNLLKHKFV